MYICTYLAWLQCKESPEKPLYDGGMLRKQSLKNPSWVAYSATSFYTQAFILHNLTQGTIYCFSSENHFYSTINALLSNL